MTQFSKWKTIGYAVAIFVAGGISGGALGVYQTKSHLFAPPPEREMAIRLLNRLQARLDLTADQVSKINPIIVTAVSDIHAIRIENTQRINKVFDDSYAQVAAILTPEQRVKLEQMQKERREMMQRHWRAGGPRYDGIPPGSPSSSNP